MLKRFLLIFLVISALIALVVIGMLPKLRKTEALKADNDSAAMVIPEVQVVLAGQAQDTLGLTLPGRLDAQRSTMLYARAQGYVTKWTADVGQNVKAGQVLATLSQPELNNDIAAAQASVDLAQANLNRLQSVTLAGAISAAEIDDAKAKLRNAVAQRQRLAALQSFQQVVAPFDGVVTERNVDVGSFVGPGASPLFGINSTAKLRVFVDVPQAEVQTASVDEGTAIVRIAEINRSFTAQIVRNAGAYNAASRSLAIQLEILQPEGLVPGMFAQVTFQPKKAEVGQQLTVPANAIYPSPTGPAVLVVDSSNRIQIRPINIYKDFGTYVVITNGVRAQEKMVINPHSRLLEGSKVRIMPSEPAPTANGNGNGH